MRRREQLADALATTRTRIVGACRAAGRDPAEVSLVVVTKSYPAGDVELLAGLGVRDVGEARDQEAAAKVRDCASLDLRWHFVGQLQTNKAASVATYADAVHSVDRARLVQALSRAAHAAGRRIDAFVQVRLGPAVGTLGVRGGALPADVPALADTVAAAEGLRLAGLMAVAPADADAAAAFAALAALGERVRADHPDATGLSAGMSGDLEHAVRHGATHVRVGSAILGSRPPGG